MNISAQDVINAIFHPDDTVCLRIFDDRKEGIFTGAKMSVEAGKFFAVESTLKEHNQKNHGIFFVVNSGGQTDDSITRINAQFVEMDDKTFEEQQTLIDAFPLPPSMVIRTRKSLHTYWFVKEAKVSLFRPIQKALVQHFSGDPACVNESRVMRLPGFYHCKKEPVLVECISFHPERRYTQEQLIERLPVSQEAEEQPKVPLHGEQKGIGIVEAECDFIKYCRDNAAALSEHDWYAMISNLSVFEGGEAVIHQYSKPYPKYSFEETQNKIQHFLRSGTKPMTCRTIAEKGFSCPKLRSGQCSCKSPAALCFQPLSIDGIRALLLQQKVQNAVVEDLQTARNFVSEYLYNVDSVTAESMIHYDLKQHFGFKNADVKPLLALQKELYKAFQNKSETRKHRSGMEIPDWYEMTERGPKFLPGLQVIHRENGGLAAARNTGLKAATGDWLLFLDSDDAMAPGLLAQLRGALAAHPDCDWFIGRHLEWQPDGTLTPHDGLHLVPGPFASSDYAARLKALYTAGHWSVWKYCIRRSFLEQARVRFLPDCVWAEDWPFDLELLLHCDRLYFLDTVFTHYRVGRQGSLLTDAKNLPKRFRGLAVAQRRLARLSANGTADAAAYAAMQDAAADVFWPQARTAAVRDAAIRKACLPYIEQLRPLYPHGTEVRTRRDWRLFQWMMQTLGPKFTLWAASRR